MQLWAIYLAIFITISVTFATYYLYRRFYPAKSSSSDKNANSILKESIGGNKIQQDSDDESSQDAGIDPNKDENKAANTNVATGGGRSGTGASGIPVNDPPNQAAPDQGQPGQQSSSRRRR